MEDEMDEELTRNTESKEVNYNNNCEEFDCGVMKISASSTYPKIAERNECALVRSTAERTYDMKNFRDSDSKNTAQQQQEVILQLPDVNTRVGISKDAPDEENTCNNRSDVHQETNLDALDINQVGRYLEANPSIAEKWILEKASPELRQRLQCNSVDLKSSSHCLHQEEQVVCSSERISVTSDLFRSWLASNSPVKQSGSSSRLSSMSLMERREELCRLNEADLFMELIRDVANELDINVLCHKILVNVGLLTHADRGSLFLVKGSQEEKYLVAKLFDVTQDTDFEEAAARARNEEIKIPFGVGVAGYVAQNKQIINIKDAYKDPRFNSAVDLQTGYKTQLILSMPICNYEGDVIGVAQIINKTNGSDEFLDKDVEVFQRYLTFCGIGIQNAQLFELSVLEYRRNQILLNLARSIFEEQNNLECLVTKIMTEAKELLKCQRCVVYLLDSECGEAGHLEKIVERPSRSIQESRKPLSRRESNNINMEDIFNDHGSSNSSNKFTLMFEMENGTEEARLYRPNASDLSKPLGRIAKYVAFTGQILNIGNLTAWLKEEVRENGTGLIKSILCMPIVNGQKTVIGVAQLINKDNGFPFTDSDVTIFEAFAIFCGLGIHNTQMYESACKLMAKQKVALECLSYHATASTDDATKLMSDEIAPAEKYNLYSFTFTDFDLKDEDTCRATVSMFMQCQLISKFHIPYNVLCRWILSVKKNYRPVKYHNWRHALNVAQSMFAILKTGKMEQFMTDLEILGLLVACLCHDLDHRGTNNAFQMKTESPLAILYSTSTMEHHHFDQCVMILNSDSNNIFQSLTMEDYRRVMRVVENAILSTDMAMYFKKKDKFKKLIDEGEFVWQSEEKKDLLCGMMMTACDVSAIAKPWDVQHRVAKLVADEFFDQGDLERLQLNQQPMPLMDRERRDELPKMQVGFIDAICLPLYKILAETFPWIQPLYDGTLENRNNWKDLAEKVEIGLTWIDRDSIKGEEPPKDVEYTTLNWSHESGGKKETTSNEFPTTSPEMSGKSSLGKFASLRKGGRTFGKGMKNRLSKSLYTKSPVDPVKPKVLLPERKHKESRNKLCQLI